MFYLALIHLAGWKVLWPIIVGCGAVGLWLAWPYLVAAVIFLAQILLGIAFLIWIIFILAALASGG